jgi:DNA polymerase-4
LRASGWPVEVWGWDEAFVGIVADDPEAVALDLKRRVLERTRLSCAVGIGESKLQAKTATGFAKPGGVARLTRREWIATMGARPVTALWGIGARTAARLGALGIHTVEQLARADHHELARHFGPTIGPHLRVLGLGGDDAPVVDEPRVAKSRGKEVTFTSDVVGDDAIADHVRRLAEAVAAEVAADGRRITHVAVKVRTASFWTRSKIAKLPDGPTIDPTVVAAGAAVVLARFELRAPVRLLGVRVVLEPPA